jgi:hypothetical protein
MLGALAALALASCGETREQLGLDRKPPDEFAVLKRAPLVQPPNYALRPPQPGAPRPQEQDPFDQAQTSVFGATQSVTPPVSEGGASDGTQSLLQEAGAQVADPAIRRKLDSENQVQTKEQESLAKKLLDIGGDEGEAGPASVVDAPAEAQRIKKNQQDQAPVTKGETPRVER